MADGPAGLPKWQHLKSFSCVQKKYSRKSIDNDDMSCILSLSHGKH